ncbi:SDR family oxidoreductase [Streptomyces sp. UH6]|uniref:SDR family oxidoreductase n=1 Tax=Streptomyces sp. UH6 TaxID=2748379 RepID=UPI0015D4AEE0|nr:SDR family oxidoreductase [Streptomyces sp. UH6]NYV76751.1 SDR family oxidoreductase [Streptomyces sp. UH6]
MDLGLTGRTVLVTGGSSGVGLATVRMLLDEGAQVATCGRRPEALERIGPHERLHTTVCDIRDAEAVARMVDGVRERFGALDGLVNNAGQSRMKPFAECTTEDWRDELELKFDGVLNPLKAALPLLRRSDAAAVVNINAVLAKEPSPRLITTSAARAGILNLSKSLSRELAADGVRVNSVCLGLIDTGQWERRYRAAETDRSYDAWQAALAADRGIALGRLGRAEEVAYAVTGLLSPRASYITGISVDVCGGISHAA